jgi:peroxiredoxin Q/BCP
VKLTQGMDAPDFAMPDASGETWRLDDLRGQTVVLYFYPADDTPGCTAEACDFRDSLSDFTGAGYTILGVSPQGAESHRAFAEKYRLNFPLLIDEDLKVADAYGAVREEPGDYKGIQLDILRSTFVIGPDGKIKEALYGVHGRGHVSDLRRLLSI